MLMNCIYSCRSEDDTNLGAVYAPPQPAYAESPKPAYTPNHAAPTCPQNLMVSCQPSVQTVPCSAYQQPASYAAAAPAYRQANYENEYQYEGFVGQPQPEQT